MPAAHGHFAGIICGIVILRSDDPIQYTGDHFGSIVLVRDQTVREFPVEFPAAAAFQPADQKPPPPPALQPHDPDAGIPVGKRLSADRAVGYSAALNKKYHFRDCK